MKADEKIVFETTIPKKEPDFCNHRFDSNKINRFLEKEKIRLYCHQVESLTLIREGKNVVITTPTSSGKSLIYILSTLEEIDKNPNSTAMLVFPLVALANDQHNKIKDYIDKTGVRASVSVYTGSTDKEERKAIKNNPPNILITTPDMLNISILPYHRSWAELLSNLKFVVIDELHSYRGVLGSHVANVIRRLNRLAKHYTGKKPQYILNSATIKNPTGFAEKLIGDRVYEVSKNGASSPDRIVRIYEKLSRDNIAGITIWFLENNIPAIVFLDSRKEIELFYLKLRDTLTKKGKENLVRLITPYRSGYTFTERREIEKKLSEGEYRLVISTSALEMGVDIGTIDACILVGYPGTLSATWQRFGRAGRRDKTAYNILIPKNNILDQYFLKNPQDLINPSIEEPVINPSNPYILKKHLMMMATEKPIELSELKSAEEKYYLRELILEGQLTFKNNKIYPAKKEFFHIRSSEEQFSIVDEDKEKIIGQLNSDYVMYEAFKDAIYIHNGKSYIVKGVDFDSQKVFVSEKGVSYFTDPLLETDIQIIKTLKHKKAGCIDVFYGDINVKSKLIGYSVRDLETYQRVEDRFFREDVYERDFQTKSMWFCVPESWEEELKKDIMVEKLKDLHLFLKREKFDRDFVDKIHRLTLKSSVSLSDIKALFEDNLGFLQQRYQTSKKTGILKDIEDFQNSLSKMSEIFVGGLHGLEHSMIGIFSIVAMNDRWDIGGLSTPLHQQTFLPTIFVYDGFEGGIGYSEVGFERFKDLVELTAKNITNCNCLSGCPSCILSPKCGNSNEFLDKTATKIILKLIAKNMAKV